MTQQVSIWRWAVEADLEAWFARLVAAPDAQFVQIGREMAQVGDTEIPSLAQLAEQTRAKYHDMNLPEDVLQTMLEGLENMLQEAREEEAAWEEETGEGTSEDGRVEVALASSHMFYDDPYASLEYEEIDHQVGQLMQNYEAAAGTATGRAGLSLLEALGIAQERLFDDAVVDVLMESGLMTLHRLWATPLGVCYLGQWQEDKKLPFDLMFGRMPEAVLDGVRAQLQAPL